MRSSPRHHRQPGLRVRCVRHRAQGPNDVIGAKRASEPGVRIVEVTGVGANRVALDAKCNTASVAASEVLRKADAAFGLDISIRKGVRPCSGMGSLGRIGRRGSICHQPIAGQADAIERSGEMRRPGRAGFLALYMQTTLLRLCMAVSLLLLMIHWR